MVQYLNYKGQKIPFKVGFQTLAKWQEETKETFDKIDALEENLILLEPLLWYAIISGCREEGMKSPFEQREEFSDAMEYIWEEFLTKHKDFIQGEEEAKVRTQEKKVERKKYLKRKTLPTRKVIKKKP